MVADLITFLDNVIEYFIEQAPDEISKAKFSATRERSLGLGAMGFHNLLMAESLPFGSQGAKDLNENIFRTIKDQAVAQSLILGDLRGEAPDMVGTGRRNANLLAIAPNANSSSIAGTSPSIEPIKANAFVHRTRVGSHLIKNKILEVLLREKGQDTPEIWNSIIANNGSIAQLDFLSAHEKDVFKTAIEIDQIDVVTLGGQRQKHICQSQSLNIFFPAGSGRKYLHDVHFEAWKQGCKSLYYLRTETSNKAENLSDKVEKDGLKEFSLDDDDCAACQA
jgi:ribonucleoside-diphosphate reductase alpha chain